MATGNEWIRASLIAAGVKNLREYGYPKVDAENILTDIIYSAFFDSMLSDNLGHSGSVDEQIHQLRHDIKSRAEKGQ